MIKSVLIAAGIICALVAFLVTDEMDYQEAKAKSSMYCQMVKAGIESGGKYGWPDFNNTYHRQCK